MKVLVGDIGGTKTILQLVDATGDARHVLRETRFDSHAYGDFLDLVREFLGGGTEAPQRACFGVAGPVEETPRGQSVATTHLPWHLDSDALSRALGIPKVLLINDFKAVGYSIAALSAADLAVIQTGRAAAQEPRVVLGAGTGLGVAQLLWCGGRYQVVASQGGHVNFAPIDERQQHLLRYLSAKQDYVSFEHVLSGPGLVTIYQFLLDTQPEPEPGELARQRRAGDAAAVITEFALAGRDARARQALQLFADIYAAYAGSLALVNLAYGGVYLAGGIAPKILPVLDSERFREVFARKGKMSALLKDIPVTVIVNTKAGLVGAMQAAMDL